MEMENKTKQNKFSFHYTLMLAILECLLLAPRKREVLTSERILSDVWKLQCKGETVAKILRVFSICGSLRNTVQLCVCGGWWGL